VKVELTIKTTYLPEWGISEGIREIVQNAKDADTEGYPMIISASKNSLRIENQGTTLSHECLLFGHTTKVDKSNQIGKFGEGLKLGTLALVRAGKKVVIRTGNEIWTPAIEKSSTFNSDVLIFNIRKTPKYMNSIQIIIDIAKYEWELESRKFLFIYPPKQFVIGSAYCRQEKIILDEDYVGKIYVKGIFVQNDSNLQCGYDLNIEVDRDRKMVSVFQLEYTLRNLWANALEENRDDILNEIFANLLENNKKDIRYFETNCFLSDYTISYLRNRWVDKYGEKTYPVLEEAHARELEFLGAKGIVIASRPFVNVYENIFGGKEQLRKNLSECIDKVYDLKDLSIKERFNFLTAKKRIEKALRDVDLGIINIASFAYPELRGLFKSGNVFISRHVLNDSSLTLAILIHEVAHYFGTDGKTEHIHAMQEIWREIYSQLETYDEDFC
jgi:hypothetical protein